MLQMYFFSCPVIKVITKWLKDIVAGKWILYLYFKKKDISVSKGFVPFKPISFLMYMALKSHMSVRLTS